MNALDAGVHVLHYLVHAHQYVYFARAMQQAGKAVGVAVDVDQLAFARDGVGAHEEAVAGEVLQQDLARFLGCGRLRAVDRAVIAGFQYGLHARFLERFRAAPSDGGPGGHQLAHQFHGIGGGFAEIAFHVAALKLFDDGLRRLRECKGARVFHGALLLSSGGWFSLCHVLKVRLHCSRKTGGEAMARRRDSAGRTPSVEHGAVLQENGW